jgi:hypothetical protein
VIVSAAPAFAPSCGNATLVAGGSTISFTGGQVAPGQTCTVTIPVQTVASLNVNDDFTYLNDPVTLTSAQAVSATAGPVTWRVRRIS